MDNRTMKRQKDKQKADWCGIRGYWEADWWSEGYWRFGGVAPSFCCHESSGAEYFWPQNATHTLQVDWIIWSRIDAEQSEIPLLQDCLRYFLRRDNGSSTLTTLRQAEAIATNSCGTSIDSINLVVQLWPGTITQHSYIVGSVDGRERPATKGFQSPSVTFLEPADSPAASRRLAACCLLLFFHDYDLPWKTFISTRKFIPKCAPGWDRYTPRWGGFLSSSTEIEIQLYPIGSMYGIFMYIYPHLSQIYGKCR